MAKEILNVLLELREKREPHAVATVVETVGSVSAKTSSKAVIDRNGRVVAGWVGGGCAESATCRKALECMESGETAILEINLDDEMLGAGMPCGGSMRVYVEPVLPKPRLWIMGHGRIAEVLCLMGDLLGFEVVVHDPGITPEKYPNATRLITDDVGYEQLQPLESDFVVIATQHKGDHESLRRALRSSARYIALIASRKRSRLVLDFLLEKGFAPSDLERVMAPAGLDLGARTPEEIALAVISQMVLIRRQGSGLAKCEQVKEALNPSAAAA
ncbi:XdhC family protein [Pelomicrobium methylotrophicum]|uniref:XdhC family protein n=1 Tax=Pelomicrobium methylotrophicum TaxID=2602750 RepID=A0A5C7EFQ2_9PROT|nr:XdhC family protein [Pelomicrobium methylotrophicum]TXF10732.1 XdhC family protein [Pelomicrobium methylotrophicum]